MACSNVADSTSVELKEENEALKKQIEELENQETGEPTNESQEDSDQSNNRQDIQTNTSEEEMIGYLEEYNDEYFSFKYSKEHSTLTMKLASEADKDFIEVIGESFTGNDLADMLVSNGSMFANELIYEFGEEFIIETVTEKNPDHAIVVHIGRELVENNTVKYVESLGIAYDIDDNVYAKDNIEEYIENELWLFEDEYIYDEASSTLTILYP